MILIYIQMCPALVLTSYAHALVHISMIWRRHDGKCYGGLLR